MLLIVLGCHLCLLQTASSIHVAVPLSVIDFPWPTEKISILQKPRDTVRPLCAARLPAMGINSNGRTKGDEGRQT